jgi:transposase
MTYINSYKGQDWLLPPSIKQMIPENHICFFVEEFVENLDFSEFDLKFEGAGAPAYHPRILAKILLQGMLSRERSSRKIASACRENFVFMYLSEKLNPDFRTICRFRKNNVNFLKQVFKETVNLASKCNLLDLSFIAIDGTSIKANANRRKVLEKEQLSKLNETIDQIFEEDLKQDELDEKLSEENLTPKNKKDFKKIVSDYRKDKNKLKEKLENAEEEFKDEKNRKKVSLTDPQSRVIKNKMGMREPSYNTQLSVDKNQIIVATDVCQDENDSNQLIPQINNVQNNVELTGNEKFSVDCGYSSGENIKKAEDNKIDLFVPSFAQAQKLNGNELNLNHDQYEYDEEKDELIVGKDRFVFRKSSVWKGGRKVCIYQCKQLKKKKIVPFFFRERLRMRDKMETKEAKQIYALRKITVEPVIGQIKENFRLRQFNLRGLAGAKNEINIVASAHNIVKIWKMVGNLREDSSDNKNLEIFIWVYYEENWIVRQPLVYYAKMNDFYV